MALDLIWPIVVGCLVFIVIKLFLESCRCVWEVGKYVNFCSTFLKRKKSMKLNRCRFRCGFANCQVSPLPNISPKLMCLLLAGITRVACLALEVFGFATPDAPFLFQPNGQIFTYFIWPPQGACKTVRGDFCFHFTDEELKTPRNEVTCLRF